MSDPETGSEESGPGAGGSEATAAAAPHPPAPPSRSAWRAVRDYAETVLVAILVVLFTTTFSMQNSVIPSASMEDTLLVGDYILVNKVMLAPADAAAPCAWLAMRAVQRNDVVVFKYPAEPDIDYIKRVIGIPGDVVEVKDKATWVNGRPLVEPWAVHRTGVTHPRGSLDGPRDNFGPVVVPDGMLFVMGDNRDYSRDSREFGFVPRSLVTGRAFVVFWSKRQRPGAFRTGGTSPAAALASLRTFHRDVRWDRILTLVR